MKVKLERIRLGITQDQLRRKVKMSPKKLVEVERGNYDILTLANMKAISAALGVSIQELFFNEEQ